ncbi:MAG: cell division protein SepF [Epulopiscium sp.]|nr:cell division protein SepF [Candidatus Epulonipiscium sp.]
MAKLFDKVMNAMGLGDLEEYEEEFEEETVEPEISPVRTIRRNNSKIVNIHTNVQMEVVVTHPESYDEAQEICNHIRAKKPVVINLEQMEHSVAQRIMDFVSGACYALDGNIQRVTQNIFLIAPENVDISSNIREELQTKGIILPWMGGMK